MSLVGSEKRGSVTMATDRACNPDSLKHDKYYNGTGASMPSLVYPTASSDDVNMNEIGGLVSLDVTMPNGQRREVSVDYNTPMLDLLICLAGKSKLNPTGLTLTLIAEDTGKPVGYKPNQTIGSLGSRLVQIASKDAVSAKTTGVDARKDKPFEVTQRFTLNLPRGQKTVVRVSPLTTLGDLMITVCRDKGLDLDLRRYVLQIPGKPGIPVDLESTVQEVGVHELNMVTEALNDRTHTVSMPDLSRPPPSLTDLTSLTNNREQKKKKGFLSFLGKKDKKNKPEFTQSLDSRSTTSLQMDMTHIPKTVIPSVPGSKSHYAPQPGVRPSSMFITSDTAAESKSKGQPLVGPAVKKRRAPAPPAPNGSFDKPPSLALSVQSEKITNESSRTGQHIHGSAGAKTLHDEASTPAFVSPQNVSRAEMLSLLHSRNSSDSSGYHELALSGCESPEATYNGAGKHKTSIDTTSIESSDNANGDGGLQESSTRELPIEEVHEKSDVSPETTGLTSSSQHSDSVHISKKKRKAPIPPVPASAPQHSATNNSELSAIAVMEDNSTSAGVKSTVAITEDNSTIAGVKLTAAVIEDTSTRAGVEPTAAVMGDDKSCADMEPKAVNESAFSVQADPDETGDPERFIDEKLNLNLENNTSKDEDFDFNDILEGVIFDEEPQSVELTVLARTEDPEVMMETASIVSENIDHLDIPSDRPCIFIPPPPPLEPAVDIEPLTSQTGNLFVDKSTVVNEDNASLVQSSVQSSPDIVHKRKDSSDSAGSVDTIEDISLGFQQAIHLGEESVYLAPVSPEGTSGYKSEMALFVERMSKVAVESAKTLEHDSLDDNESCLSIPFSDNSDTGSVIRHPQTDSGSEAGSLTRKEGQKLRVVGIQSCVLEYPEDCLTIENVSASEEISEPFETLPPPPEFDDRNESLDNTSNVSGKDNDNITQTLEQHTAPLGPGGYVFSAAKKVASVDRVRAHVTQRNERKDTFESKTRNKIISEFSTPAPGHDPQPKQEMPSPTNPLTKREEYVLTNDDLSNVYFLPPKPIAAKPYVETQPYSRISTASLIMSKHNYLVKDNIAKMNSSNFGNFETQDSRVHLISQSEVPKNFSSKEKHESLQNMPAVKPFIHTSSRPSPSEEDLYEFSNDPLLTKLRPRLVMNSNNSSSRRSVISQVESANIHRQDTRNQGDDETIMSQADEREDMDSKAVTSNLSMRSQQEIFQGQYENLQAQFSQWQDQLARNQNLLASQTIEPDECVQQKSFAALTLNQQQRTVSRQETLEEDPVKQLYEPLTPTSGTAKDPPSPPPLLEQKSKVLKGGVSLGKHQVKSRIEREPDPWEQLMAAIRNFSKGGLKSVSVQETNWGYSNR